MSDRLTVNDARRAGFCVSGIKRKCEALGVNFRAFVRNGLPVEEAEKFNDGSIQKAIEIAKARDE